MTTGLENEDVVEIVPGDGTTMLEPGQLVLTEGHYTDPPAPQDCHVFRFRGGHAIWERPVQPTV